jgi:hypothetical protein
MDSDGDDVNPLYNNEAYVHRDERGTTNLGFTVEFNDNDKDQTEPAATYYKKVECVKE